MFDRNLVDGLVHQLLERHQVLLELSEHLSGGHPRTGLDARVQVGHQCDCGIAHLELPGEDRLRIAGDVHQREALVRKPATLRASGEPRTLDHHHGAAVDHTGQRRHGSPQRRTVGVGEPDVEGARFEVRVGARPRPVDELIGHHHRPRPELGGEAAHRARREDPAHPQRAQRPHVCAVRHGVRGELVADAVARKERDLVIADHPDGQRRARGAVRRVEADTARIGTEERVETAASDDSQHAPIVVHGQVHRSACFTRDVTREPRDASIGLRIGVAALLGVAAAVLVGLLAGWPYAPATGWIVAAAVYLTWIWLEVGGLNAHDTARHATRYREDDSTPWILDLGVLIASVASLGGVGYLLVAESAGGDIVAAVVGALSVAAAWLTVHTVYMLRYARLYYGGDDEGGIDFHESDDYRPDYGDFAYLAFTLGMTYQVSDTDLTDRRVRMAALRHALLSFLLGAIVLAIVINLGASLVGAGH